MSKKRNRQPDANPEASEGSSESCDESSTGEHCPHIARAINRRKLKKNIKKGAVGLECTPCKKNLANSPTSNGKEHDNSQVQNGIWLCLQCGNQACGRERNGHAMEHFKKPFSDCHSLVVDTLHWTVWCYHCEIEINPSTTRKLLDTVMSVKKLASQPSPVVNNASQLQDSKNSRQVIQNGTSDSQQTSKSDTDLPRIMGLTNLGNTCFFNAVLQCLAQTPYLVKVLEDLRLPGQKFILPGGKHKPSNSSEEVELPPIKGTLEGWGSFTSILCKTLVEMQSSKGHQTYTPSELLNCYRKKTIQCVDGGQHDSHELLRHLLEIVRNEDLRRYQSIILKEVGLNEKTNPDGVEDSLKSRVKFYGNQASARLLGPELVFRGVLVSTLECLDCHHVTTGSEPFLDLSLPVVADKPQPPFLKRKNPLYEETFDATNISLHTSTKPQLRTVKKSWVSKPKSKEEIDRITAALERLVDSVTVVDDENTPIEMNTTALEVDGGDADLEDNVEGDNLLPDAEESQSSTGVGKTDSGQFWRRSTFPPRKSTNCQPPPPPPPDLNSATTPATPTISDTITNCWMHMNLRISDFLRTSGSPDNEAPTQSGSVPTSLAIHSDLTSPDWPTASLSSFASPERDSPTPNSPCSPPSPTCPVARINNQCSTCLSCNATDNIRNPDAVYTANKCVQDENQESNVSSHEIMDYKSADPDNAIVVPTTRALALPSPRPALIIEEICRKDNISVDNEDKQRFANDHSAAPLYDCFSNEKFASGEQSEKITATDDHTISVVTRCNDTNIDVKFDDNGDTSDNNRNQGIIAMGHPPLSNNNILNKTHDSRIQANTNYRSAPYSSDDDDVVASVIRNEDAPNQPSPGFNNDYFYLSCLPVNEKARNKKNDNKDREAKTDDQLVPTTNKLITDGHIDDDNRNRNRIANNSTNTNTDVSKCKAANGKLEEETTDNRTNVYPFQMDSKYIFTRNNSASDDEEVAEKKVRKEEKEKEKKAEERNGRKKLGSPLREKPAEMCNGVNGAISLQSCLNQFTALELMSGSNKVGCEACTARERKVKGDCKMVYTPSTKQYLIAEVPAVLILHLKRFQAQRFDFRKTTKHVSFPMLLDLSSVCKGRRKPRIYALYGVVEHSGTIHGGHYVAYVKARHSLAADDPRWSFLPSRDATYGEDGSAIDAPTPAYDCSSHSDSETEEGAAKSGKPVGTPSGKWYYVSDSRVSEVDERTVLQSQAYLLFYERIL